MPHHGLGPQESSCFCPGFTLSILKATARADNYAKQGDGIRAKELRATVLVGWAADALQAHKIMRTPWSEVIKNARIVEGGGEQIPIKIKQQITSKYCQELLAASKFSEWVDCTFPFKEPDDADEPWTFEQPKFKWCMQGEDPTPERAAEPLDDSFSSVVGPAKDYKKEMENRNFYNNLTGPSVWFEALFCEAFMAALDEAASQATHADSSADSNLVQMLDAWLCRWEQSESAEDLKDVNSIVTTFKGLLGLVSPVPSHHGADCNDVDYVMGLRIRQGNPPAKSVHNMITDIPRFGKLLTQSLKTGDCQSFWQGKLDLYKKHLGAEKVYGPRFQKLRDGSNVHDPTESLEWIKQFCTLMKDMKEATREPLRPGATNVIETEALRICQELHKSSRSLSNPGAGPGGLPAAQVGGWSAETGRVLHNALSYIKISEAAVPGLKGLERMARVGNKGGGAELYFHVVVFLNMNTGRF